MSNPSDLQHYREHRAAPATGLLLLLVCSATGTLAGLPSAPEAPNLTGVWSGVYTRPDDPRWRLEDFACLVGCRADVYDALARLIADPAHAAESFDALVERAGAAVPPWPALLSAQGRARLAQFTPADDPSLRCEPKGLSREVTNPFPLEIEQTHDRVIFRYEQWQTVRPVALRHRSDGGDGHGPASAGAAAAGDADVRALPGMEADPTATRLGLSIGHYERGELVIETTGIAANLLTTGGVPHSNALRAVERYRLVDGGGRLELELSLHDPVMFVAPIVMRKAWIRTPGEHILEERCELISGRP